MVSKIIEDIRIEAAAEAAERTTREHVKKVAKAFSVSPEEAMDVLEIPPEDRDRYREKLP